MSYIPKNPRVSKPKVTNKIPKVEIPKPWYQDEYGIRLKDPHRGFNSTVAKDSPIFAWVLSDHRYKRMREAFKGSGGK